MGETKQFSASGKWHCQQRKKAPTLPLGNTHEIWHTIPLFFLFFANMFLQHFLLTETRLYAKLGCFDKVWVEAVSFKEFYVFKTR